MQEGVSRNMRAYSSAQTDPQSGEDEGQTSQVGCQNHGKAKRGLGLNSIQNQERGVAAREVCRKVGNDNSMPKRDREENTAK